MTCVLVDKLSVSTIMIVLYMHLGDLNQKFEICLI